jgi:hypothetical protein
LESKEVTHEPIYKQENQVTQERREGMTELLRQQKYLSRRISRETSRLSIKGYNPVKISIFSLLALTIVLTGCQRTATVTNQLLRYPIDDMENLIFQPGMDLDRTQSFDGLGSLRIFTVDSATFRLYEIDSINVENTHLTYHAKIKTKDLKGRVYLEMWCRIPGKGEFFSRNLQMPVTGTVDWVTEETFFFLKPKENPDNIKLNLVVAGSGTVWIDDIRLLSTPL